MIDRTHKLSLTKQAKVLGISRGSVYYRLRPVSDIGLGLFPYLSMIACTHLPVIDGRGAWRGNVFVERLWRTIKYKEVYLHTVPEARAAIRKHLIFYNTKRTHSSFDGQAPNQVYINAKSPIPVTA